MKVRVCFAVAPRVRTRLLSANLMIPESQHNKSMAREEFRPRLIVSLTCTVVMPAAVQLDD